MEKPQRKISLEQPQVDGVSVRLAKSGEFRPQGVNANSHTQRGIGMLGDSMNRDGYVTPMTAAANGEIIDGSARLEVSNERLGDDVIVIEHDGKKPIITVRTDVPNADTDMAKRIAVAANRVAELNLNWDRNVLESLNMDLTSFFAPYELEKLLLTANPNDPNGLWKGMPEFNQEDQLAWKSVRVNFRNAEDMKKFIELVGQAMTEKTRSIWYPEAEWFDGSDKVIKSES